MSQFVNGSIRACLVSCGRSAVGRHAITTSQRCTLPSINVNSSKPMNFSTSTPTMASKFANRKTTAKETSLEEADLSGKVVMEDQDDTTRDLTDTEDMIENGTPLTTGGGDEIVESEDSTNTQVEGTGSQGETTELPTSREINPPVTFATQRESHTVLATRLALLNALRENNYSSAWNIYKNIYRKGVMTKHYSRHQGVSGPRSTDGTPGEQYTQYESNGLSASGSNFDTQTQSNNKQNSGYGEDDIKSSLLERGDHSLMLWCAVHHEVPEIVNKLSDFVFKNIRSSGYNIDLSDAKALMWLALRSKDAMRAYFILVTCNHHNIKPDMELLKIAMSCFSKARQIEMVEGCWKDIMKIPAGVSDPDAWAILIKAKARCGDFDGALETVTLLDKLSYSNRAIIQHSLMIAYGYMGDTQKIQEVRELLYPSVGTLKCEVEAYRRAGDYERCIKAYAFIKALPTFIPGASYHVFRMVSNSMDLLRLFYEEGLSSNQQCLTILTERLLIEEQYYAGLYHLYMMITRMVPLTPMLQKAREAAGIDAISKSKAEYTMEEGMKFYKYDPKTSQVDWELLNKYAHELTRSKLL